MLKSLLAHPLTRNLRIDDPETTRIRRRIIQEKPFLRRIYQEWYGHLASRIRATNGRVLELGSGAGFLRSYISNVITSDVFATPGVDLVLDGSRLPFADSTLTAIVMVDVLHHVSEPRLFFTEAQRCLQPGGMIVMVEPWVTRWSMWVYSNFHHEPFNPSATNWEFESTGPLTGANGALPWMLFSRDRRQFEREFPAFEIEAIELDMPFSYLMSGGVSLRSLMPGWSYRFWRTAEQILSPWMPALAMFARIQLKRRV